jgi:hypothetical protein
VATVKTVASWLGIFCMLQLLGPASLRAASVGTVPMVAGTYSTSVHRTQTRAHGVVLSVSMARRTYPQDALVRITVRLVNVSKRAVRVDGTEAAVCDQQGPGIRVTDSTDQTLYPPAIAWLFASCGPPIIPHPLLPGHAVQRRFLAVLRGNRIQAVASIGASSLEIATPLLSVVLVPEPAPQAVVHSEFLSHIDVTPSASGQRGRFYYMESEGCLGTTPGAGGSVGSAAGTTRFQFTLPDQDGVYRFSTMCGSPARWSFTGGWLNHPAVTVDYSAPRQITP